MPFHAALIRAAKHGPVIKLGSHADETTDYPPVAHIGAKFGIYLYALYSIQNPSEIQRGSTFLKGG